MKLNKTFAGSSGKESIPLFPKFQPKRAIATELYNSSCENQTLKNKTQTE